MNKMLFALSLAALAVLASTDDAFSRPSGGGGSARGRSSGMSRGGVGRGSVGRGVSGRSYGGGAYNRGAYNRGGYNRGDYNRGGYYGGGYYGSGYYGGGLLGGFGYGGAGYYPLYQGGDVPSYYGGMPGYLNDSAPTPLLSETPLLLSSATPAAAQQQFASVTVLVPTKDAQVWFENKATTQQGMKRSYDSPPLTPNHTYTYSIKARWMEKGIAVKQDRQVNVQAGQNVTVSFDDNSSEELVSPTSGNAIVSPRR